MANTAHPRQIPERLLARLWRSREWRRHRLTLTDGRHVRVLYPGRPGGGPGPDFRDAVLEVPGSAPVRGDVEIHRKPGEWQRHGHHVDAAYNGVVLHVVLQTHGRQTSRRQDGEAIPIAALNPEPEELTQPEPERSEPPGQWRTLERWRSLPPDRVNRLLEVAGHRRFLARSHRLRSSLAREGREKLLYRSLLEALGYSRNQAPFGELAERIPWSVLQTLAVALPSPLAAAVSGLLLGAAGLLAAPQVRRDTTTWPPEEWPAREGAWRLLGGGDGMEASRWRYGGVRPSNQPHRRLAGAAILLSR